MGIAYILGVYSTSDIFSKNINSMSISIVF